MKKFDSVWKNSDNWKTRYKQLYSIRSRRPSDVEPPRISFMSDSSTPYSALLLKLSGSPCDANSTASPSPPHLGTSYCSGRESSLPSLGVHDTLLLNMVCSHNREVADEVHDVPELPRCDDLECILSQDTYGYGPSMSMRTERSISRSRVSRMSTRRDMDIPSILAFTASVTTPVGTNLLQTFERTKVITYTDSISPFCVGFIFRQPPLADSNIFALTFSFNVWMATIVCVVISILALYLDSKDASRVEHLAHPAFHKIANPQAAEPRWSIRRSVCPVCSQKWRDRSSIYNIKNSGLKRNLSSDLPSVIIPARLRSSITMGYKLPPIPTVGEENSSVFKAGIKRSSASWQLTRARRLRMPQPQLPSPEATGPPKGSAPMARKDLDSRIAKFLSDDFQL